MSARGTIDLPSKYSVVETMNRLQSILKSKGIAIFAHIDQAAEAKAVGLTSSEALISRNATVAEIAL